MPPLAQTVMPPQAHPHPTGPTKKSRAQPPGGGLVLSALKLGAGAILPAQKRFNQLLSQTETLAKKIEDSRALADAHRGVAGRTLAPLAQERNGLMRQMALWLHARLQRKGLSAKQINIASEILCGLAGALASSGDEAMRALYDTHSKMTLDQAERADAADMKMFMEDVLGEPMGDDDATFESLDELMRASMARMQKAAAAEEAAHADRQNKHKKSAAQLKAEAKASALFEDATGALRTLYRQLVSALHPDRETDHAQQLRKTAWMKEANAAYEKRDLLALLQLQWRAELKDAGQLASLPKEKLAALTALLKDRVKVLTDEFYALERQMVGEFELPMFSTLGAAALRRHLKHSELNLRSEIALMKQDLLVVQDDVRFKRWLREQQKASQDDFDPFGGFDPSDPFHPFR